MVEAAEDAPQVTCCFVTKLPSELRVPEAALTVPGNLTRYGLSQIVNHLLGLDPPKPFDFLINDELVRSSLQEHLLGRGLSAESVTRIEYIALQLPPSEGKRTPHDDWVSALTAGPAPGNFYSASYDGRVRAVPGASPAGDVLFETGSQALKALARGEQGLYTAGDAGVVSLWHLPIGSGANARCVARLESSAEGLAALACSAGTSGGDDTMLAAGGWDRGVRLWRETDVATAAAEAPPAPAGKRRKAGAAAETPVAQVSGVDPAAELKAHTGAVSSLTWESTDRLVSGGWDRGVRRWDVATATCVDSLVTGKAVFAVAAAPLAAPLVALAGAEAAVRLWDGRAAAGGADTRRLLGHAGWVDALAWHPDRPHLLASVGHDGTARLWDVRAAIPLHTLAPGVGRLLAVAWSGDELAVGGEGGQVATFKL